MTGQRRRLSDKIIEAFEAACAQDDAEVAESLYRTLEIVLTRHGGAGVADKRYDVEFIRQASERLEMLRAGRQAA